MKISFHPDGSEEERDEGGKIDLMIRYLIYYKKHVFYLPVEQPEAIIWNPNYAENLVGERNKKRDIMNDINNKENNKSKFYILKNAIFDTDEKIDNLYSMFIKHWLDEKDQNYRKIIDLINKIRGI